MRRRSPRSPAGSCTSRTASSSTGATDVRARDLIGTAMRNLRRQKLRSSLTIFAVVIGATSVTIMLALVTGAKDFFLQQFESTGQLQQVIVSQATDLDYDHARFANSSSDSGTKLTDDLVRKISKLP